MRDLSFFRSILPDGSHEAQCQIRDHKIVWDALVAGISCGHEVVHSSDSRERRCRREGDWWIVIGMRDVDDGMSYEAHLEVRAYPTLNYGIYAPVILPSPSFSVGYALTFKCCFRQRPFLITMSHSPLQGLRRSRTRL